MRFGSLTGGLALLLLPATGVRAAIVIEHSGVGCVVAGQFPRFEARFQPASDVSRARLHFRPAGGPHWYSVPMRAEGGEFAGVIPKPKKSLKQLEYYIEATDTAFGTSRTAEYKPEVASGPGACKDKLVARALSAASVLIEGPAGAPLVPVGFDPAGVIPLSGTPGASTQAPSSSGTGSTTGSSAGTGTATTAGSAAGAGGVGTKAFLGAAHHLQPFEPDEWSASLRPAFARRYRGHERLLLGPAGPGRAADAKRDRRHVLRGRAQLVQLRSGGVDRGFRPDDHGAQLPERALLLPGRSLSRHYGLHVRRDVLRPDRRRSRADGRREPAGVVRPDLPHLPSVTTLASR